MSCHAYYFQKKEKKGQKNSDRELLQVGS